MNKNIYATSDEKFVKATILFSSGDKIYYDTECTEEVILEDALNLFKKGLMLVSVDGGFKRPTGITVTEDGYTISFGEGGGSGFEDFVVTLTLGDDENYVSSHSRAEIAEAYEAGKHITGVLKTEGDLILVFNGIGNDAAIFFSVIDSFMMLMIDDDKAVTTYEMRFLPEVYDSDAGKVLTVDENGSWIAELPAE